MYKGRGRGIIYVDSPRLDENYSHGRTNGSGGSRNPYIHHDDAEFHNQHRNPVNEHGFGPPIGDPRQGFHHSSHSSAGPESNRMMKFMPDPRLQPKIIPHGVDQHPYSSNENPNYMMEEPISHAKGKSLRPSQSGSPLVGFTRLSKPNTRNNDGRHEQHLNEERFDRQYSSNSQESFIVDENIQQDVNLDSLVHNLLDSLDDGIVYDDQSCQGIEEGEVQEEPEDFPTRYANYHRSFDDFEKHAVALPCDPRLQKTTTSTQASSGQISSKKDAQVTARVKSEARERITGPEQDDHNPENNLKQALEDIRQRQHIPSTTASSVPSYSEIAKSKPSKNKTASEPQPKKLTPPNVSSNKKDGKGPHQSQQVNDKSDKTRRKVVEDSGSKNSNRSSRNSSPVMDRRGRNASDRTVLGSPEWSRQVRMVDRPEYRNRDSREREMRRVRRLSRSRTRSRSRSRSPRRTQRYFRYGSPPEHRLRSRSPISRRSRRFSPEYPHRRWGPMGPGRHSRSPVRIRDRRRSPSDHSQRNVVERTVIMRQQNRSFSRSTSRSPSPRSSSQHQNNSKRFKDRHDSSATDKPTQPLPPPSSSSSSSINSTAAKVDSPVPLQATQLFTRNYVVANQVDHVAHVVQPTQLVQPAVTATRYVVPPPSTVPHNVSSVPPLMGYYNQHYQASVQQQIDIITYQHQQQQQHNHHLQQQQLYQQHLQQMNQNHVAHNNMPSSALIPIIHPAGVVHSPVRHNIPPTKTVPNLSSTSTQPVAVATQPTTNSEGASVEGQRIRVIRDGLLEKQAKLVHQMFVIQGQQTDLEMKLKTAGDAEYERLSNNIIEKAKFGKEMMVSVQSLEKIIQKHTIQLKEDLSELKKTRSSNRYNYYDPQQHWCELCDVITDKLNDYLNHLHSKEHEERLQSTGVPSTPWQKNRSITPEEKGGTRIPFNGLQNLQPVKAWYCELCDVWIGDLLCAKLHMSSSSHNDQHLKRNMERPDSLLNHTMKKQAALRRNFVQKKEEEKVRNQQKEADKMKMNAEKAEAMKIRADELKEKQRLLKEKWQDFVRIEEANNASVVELEGPTEEKTATIQRPSDGSASSSIRLNIRTPLITLKTPDLHDTAETPISSLMETSDSIEGQVIPTEKETPTELSTEQVFIDTINKESFEQRTTLDVQTEESNVVNPTQNIVRSDKIDVEALPCADVVAEKADVPDSLPMDSSDKEETNNPSMTLNDEASKGILESSNLIVSLLSVEKQQPGAIVLHEKNVSDLMDASACSEMSIVCETDMNSKLINNFEQMVPISQNDVPSSAVTRTIGETDDAGPECKGSVSVPEQIQQVDENSQDQLDSSPKTGIDSECLDVQGNIENVVQDPLEHSGVSGNVLDSNIDVSLQDSSSKSGDGQEKRLNVIDGALLPKIEPKDPEDPINDCCVILEVNPKLTKVPELIDLESSNEECDLQDTEPKKQMEVSENSKHSVTLSEGDEEKCDSLHVDDNRSSTPKIQFGEFIVLSETAEDSSGIDADSCASTNSTSEQSSGERLIVAVEETPGDEAATNQIP